MRRNRFLLVIAGLVFAASHAEAEKKVTVKVIHPATLGHMFPGKRVFIGPVSGECSKEFADLLAPDLAKRASVLSGPELDTLLAAHHVQIGSLGDPSAAAPLAKALGPSLMLTIDVSRCDARRREPMLGSGLPAPHISRVEGKFEARVRAIDLASGKEAAAYIVRAEAAKENRSETGIPEYPSLTEVKELTVAKSLSEAQHMYRPWAELQELPFMDDKDCNQKQAFDLVKAGDTDGALKLSRESAASCKAGAKIRAGALYNLGVLLMMKQNYDEAVASFKEAQKLNNRKAVAEVLDDCRKDKELAAAMKAAHAPVVAAEGAPGQTGIVMTNEFIVKLVQANVAEAEIIKMIGAQPAKFALGPEDLGKLQEAGVSAAIVSAMRAKK